MSYGTSLVAGTDVANLVGLPHLANLSASGEITLNTFVLSAHQEVYSMLRGMGIDPTLLTNETELRAAVALMAVAAGAEMGQIQGVDAERVRVRAERLVKGFTPLYSTANSPRRADEGIPLVGHVDGGFVFHGDFPAKGLDFFSGDTPSGI